MSDCEKCAEHNHCSIESLGGEAAVFTSAEMDAVMGASEAGMEQLSRTWGIASSSRDRLLLQLNEAHERGDINYLLSQSPEGVAYFQFCLRQIATMESIIETIGPILSEVRERADGILSAMGTKGN